MTMGMDARHVYSRLARTYSSLSSTQFAIQCPQIALSKMPRAKRNHLDLEAMRLASSVSGRQSKVSRDPADPRPRKVFASRPGGYASKSVREKE